MTSLTTGLTAAAWVSAATGAAGWVARRGSRRHVLGRLQAGAAAAASDAPRWVLDALHDAGLDGRPVLARRLWWGSVAGGALGPALGWVVGGAPLAVLVGAAWASAPVLARRVGAGRRLRIADNQVAAALDEVARALRGGGTVVSAVRDASVAVPPPLAAELGSVVASVDAGAGLVAALDAWVVRSPRPPVRLTATVLALAAGTGGAAARAVDSAAASLRAQQEVAAEARALAAQARYSALVIGLAPLGFLAVVGGLDPATVDFLLRTPLGLACLTAGLLLDGLGAWWMHRIVGRPA